MQLGRKQVKTTSPAPIPPNGRCSAESSHFEDKSPSASDEAGHSSRGQKEGQEEPEGGTRGRLEEKAWY